MRRLIFLALGLASLAGAGFAVYRGRPPPPAPAAALGLDTVLRGDDAAYARVTAPRTLRFPADHGPHPDYRSEWWYFTGNLAAASGRRFGFELTFFRFALAPAAVKRRSAWATNQIYLAHFALTDVAGGRMHAFERAGRAALDLAGARARPFRVWVGDWAARAVAGDGRRVRLTAASGSIAIDLELGFDGPFVAHGENGMSRKSAEPGNASYYYSDPRMPVRGTIRIGGTATAVRGLAWLDREWGSTMLAVDQAGWDWFALQLDDGRALMFYQLRRRDGGVHPFSAGTLIDAGGEGRALGSRDVEIQVLGHWRSPRDGARYPSRWALTVPSAALRLEVEPFVADQELNLSIRYWEGAVSVRGTAGGRAIAGNGYVELVGYGGPGNGQK